MKTTENSSKDFNDEVKRLFSGMLLGSLLLLTSFKIWAQPTTFEVTGGGSYCIGGEGVPVGLSDSEIGVTYTLLKDNIPQLPEIDGTGEAITFGNQVAGTYTISGTNGDGTTPMTGNAVVIENPLPETPTITPSGPTTFCDGGSVTLTSGPGATWLWSTGATTQSIDVTESGNYTVRITDGNGCQSDLSEEIIITVDQLPTLATIDVSPLNYCGTLVSGSLRGNTPAVGTGEWSIVSGGTGTFSNSADGNSTFTADAAGTYVLRWTISNGTCTPRSADVTVNYYETPTIATITTTPLNYCGILTSGALGGNTPAVGTGEWSIVSGGTGTFSNSADGNSMFTADAAGTYVLRWTISNGTCTPSSADVSVNFYKNFTTSFVAGWNWFSVNTLHENMSLNNIMSTGFTDGDYIKNQTSFAFYSSTDGWQGSLNVIDPNDLYIVRVQDAASLDFCGTAVNVNSTPIPVVAGWNWIGYLPGFTLPLDDALNSLTVVTGDYIKNQTGYADYYGTSWFGSLANMNPGEGYMLRLTNPGELLYPDSPAKNSQQPAVLPADNSFSPHKFEFNGSVTANVILDGSPARSEKDRLYAYVDDEIRGIAHGLYMDFKDTYIFPLMIYSNKPEGEIVHFRYYNSGENKFYECLENIQFKTDMIISDPFKSFRMNVVSEKKSAIDDVAQGFKLIVYPNPFKDILNIGFTIPEITDVRLTVSDQYGNIVKVLSDQELIPDNYTIQWVCEDEPSGMYIIRLQAGNRFIVQKVVVFR